MMADWKYVMWAVQDGDNRQLPVLFPNELNHVDVTRALNRVMSNSGRRSAPVVSAGFVNALSVVSTFGESESLGGLKSREEDAGFINKMPYDNGRETVMPSLEVMLLMKTVELLMGRIKDLTGVNPKE